MKTTTKSYNKWILAASVAIPVVVAILFRVRLKNVEPLYILPPIYATINGLTAIFLLSAVRAIRMDNIKLHKKLMKVCILFSLIFLTLYVAYHMTSDPTPYGGKGLSVYLYYFILVSHIILSIAVIPLVLISYVRALAERFDKHKRIAKITFPIWLYVAITGVIVYLMIMPYYNY